MRLRTMTLLWDECWPLDEASSIDVTRWSPLSSHFSMHDTAWRDTGLYEFLHRSCETLCMRAERMFVRSSVCPSWNVRSCSPNKRLDLEAPIFANACTLTMYIRLQIFIRILNVLDLHFKGKRFESNTLASSYVKILMRSILCRQDGLYQSPRFQEVSGRLIQ